MSYVVPTYAARTSGLTYSFTLTYANGCSPRVRLITDCSAVIGGSGTSSCRSNFESSSWYDYSNTGSSTSMSVQLSIGQRSYCGCSWSQYGLNDTAIYMQITFSTSTCTYNINAITTSSCQNGGTYMYTIISTIYGVNLWRFSNIHFAGSFLYFILF